MAADATNMPFRTDELFDAIVNDRKLMVSTYARLLTGDGWPLFPFPNDNCVCYILILSLQCDLEKLVIWSHA